MLSEASCSAVRPRGCRAVFVGNLAWGDAGAVRAHFAGCGPVAEVSLDHDRLSGEFKRSARVQPRRDQRSRLQQLHGLRGGRVPVVERSDGVRGVPDGLVLPDWGICTHVVRGVSPRPAQVARARGWLRGSGKRRRRGTWPLRGTS